MGGLRTGIRPGYIAATSKMVTDCSGMVIQPHKVCPGCAVWHLLARADTPSLPVSTSCGATCMAPGCAQQAALHVA